MKANIEYTTISFHFNQHLTVWGVEPVVSDITHPGLKAHMYVVCVWFEKEPKIPLLDISDI